MDANTLQIDSGSKKFSLRIKTGSFYTLVSPILSPILSPFSPNSRSEQASFFNDLSQLGTPSKTSSVLPPRTTSKILKSNNSEIALAGSSTKIHSTSVTLRQLFIFTSTPPPLLDDFYHYCRDKEQSEANVEFCLGFRNHALIYARYRDIRKQYHSLEDGPEIVPIQTRKTRTIPRKIPEFLQNLFQHDDAFDSVGDLIFTNIGSMYIDLDVLRCSAELLLQTFIVPDAKRALTLPESVRRQVQKSLEIKKRYDPAVFSKVCRHVFEYLRNDSFPRYLRDQNLNSS
jgi:hypothetical protein